MAVPEPCVEHVPARREINPKTLVYTVRCSRCGAVLQRYSQEDLDLL